MFDYQEYVIESFAGSLRNAYQKTYGLLKPDYGTIIEWTGRLSLEIISNTDMYLQVTVEGKQWISNLYAHVFSIEHHHIGNNPLLH